MDNMEIIEMTRELGNSIRESVQMENLRKSEQALQNDAKGKQLMDEYTKLHRELMTASKQNREQEVLEDIQKMLADMQSEMEQYEITRNYLDASNSFNKLINNVNQVLVTSIRGEESGCSADGCDSCDSCG